MGNTSAAIVAAVTTTTRPLPTSSTGTVPRIATMATTSPATSAATGTSRTSGETMNPAAVLLDRSRRAGDASGVLQFMCDADALPRHDTARHARAAAVQRAATGPGSCPRRRGA
jgi:hypothetical protein